MHGYVESLRQALFSDSIIAWTSESGEVSAAEDTAR
jgi:hypothetical protein